MLTVLMKSVSNRRHPVVVAFRDLARTPDPDGVRLLLDGVHLVSAAHEARSTFEVVALSARVDGATQEATVARALDALGVQVVLASDQVFEAMSPVRSPSGIVAIVRRSATSAAEICRTDNAFVLAATDIQDPGNLGALLRAGEAAGSTGVLVCGTSASPFSWKAARGSMGSVLRTPVTAGLTLDAALQFLRDARVRVIAAAPRGGRDPEAVNWRGSVALVVGGEGAGLDDQTLAQADERVTIPMVAPVESLNVAVAAGILMYAARRQRQ